MKDADAVIAEALAGDDVTWQRASSTVRIRLVGQARAALSALDAAGYVVLPRKGVETLLTNAKMGLQAAHMLFATEAGQSDTGRD